MIYKDFLKDWLENYVKISTKPKTYESYSEIVRTRLIPNLGEYELNQLSPMIVQKYITQLMCTGNLKTGKGLSVNSINAIIAVIQNSFSVAYTLGMVKEYQMNKIKRPKNDEKQISCFSISEQKQIEKACKEDKRLKMIGVVICLYTGLRLGELLALQWDDINFEKIELTVNKTAHEIRTNDKTYSRIVNTPKTVSSCRVIPIPKQIMPMLKNAKKNSISSYVIAQGKNAVCNRSYQKSFELLLKKLNIPHRGFHALRHTFATRALECGMDVKTLSEILGHKNPNVTLNRYAHSLMDHKREMMNKLGKIF